MNKLKRLSGVMAIVFLLTTLLGSIPVYAEEDEGKRIYGSDRFETAKKIAEEGWPNGSQYVVLVRGEANPGEELTNAYFADGVVGATLAKAKNAPILLTKKDKIPNATKEALEFLKPAFIYIIGGDEAVSTKVENELKKDYLVRRLGGADRYETAAKVAEELYVLNSITKAVVVPAFKFEEAVAVASYAANEGMPILFTPAGQLNSVTADCIRKLRAKEVKIIGDENAVAEDVKKELEALNVKVERIKGEDRYDLAVKVAEAFKPMGGYDGFVLVRGDDCADALSVAPWAAGRKAVLFIDKDGNEAPAAVKNFLKANAVDMANKIVSIGGSSAVPVSVANDVVKNSVQEPISDEPPTGDDEPPTGDDEPILGEVKVQKIRLFADKEEIQIDESLEIIADVWPLNASNKDVSWHVYNVAPEETDIVDYITEKNKIIITGKKEGVVEIKAVSTDGSNVEGEITIVVGTDVPTVKEYAEIKLELLKALVEEAEAKGLDVEREKCTIWMAEQFLKFADWDEQHVEENKMAFDAAPMYRTQDTRKLAEELPDFERREVLKMVAKSIQDLKDVMAGEVVRKPVRKVTWDNITVEGDQFINGDGKPIFLYDYFSKAHGAPQDDPDLYNDYLGDITHPLSISLALSADENGSLTDRAYDEIINFDELYPSKKNNIGYMFLWHSGNIWPQWVIDKYGKENLSKGISKYTAYDIDNPHIREIWTQIFDGVIPQIKEKPYTKLGYILANEPHWVTDKDNTWFAVKNGISDDTLNKFRDWLKNKYNGDISRLNELWGANYESFDEITIDVPMDIASIRGTPKCYDWCRFNMDRVTEWFTFLHDGIKQHDSNAKTHIKIFPRFITDENGYRDHGIDIEALSNLTEFLGHDATIRKRLYNSTEPEPWEENYAYYWREIAMISDLLSSFDPDKIIVNTESHFISTNTYRDKEMQPEYVRSVYWLSTILGTRLNLTWWWPRYGDGSIEPRLLSGAMNPQGYPGSVIQMPRVANEITQTFMDLNAFATDIVKFQKQEKPIRIFYSETENINDKDQINKVFSLYESMYFEGVPIGFATKGVIENSKGTFDVMVVYDTECVTDEEFAAIQKYLDNGGTVIIDSVSLTKNEYKEERAAILNESNGRLIRVEDNSIENMSAQAFSVLEELGKMPIVRVVEDNGTNKKGCIWRVVDGEDDANKLLTVINVGKNTATLHITKLDNPSAKIVDMFTGREMPSTVTIPPEGILFLNVGTKNGWTKPVEATKLENPVAVAVPKDQAVELYWVSVENAKSYEVYEVDGDNYRLIESNIKGTKYKVTGLENGVEYTFVVIAKNEEMSSDIAQAKKLCATPVPLTLPKNPTGLTAEAGDSCATLRWEAVEGADGYNVYMVEGTSYTLVKEGVTSLSCTIDSLENGREYTFAVTAVKGALESEKASAPTVKVTPVSSVPTVQLKSVLTEEQELYFSFDAYEAEELTVLQGTSGKWWISGSDLLSITREKSYEEKGFAQSMLFNGDPSTTTVNSIFFATTPNAMDEQYKPELPEGRYYIEAMVYLEGEEMSDIDIVYARQGTWVMTAKLPCSSTAKQGEWVKVTSTVLKNITDKSEINSITKDLQLRLMYPKNGTPTKFYIDNIKIVTEDVDNN